MGSYDDRKIYQVFVGDMQFTTESSGLRASGHVEVNLSGVSPSPQGPTVKVGLSIAVDASDTPAVIAGKFVSAAKDVIDRIAQEPAEHLIQQEAKPYDDKWPTFGSEPNGSED